MAPFLAEGQPVVAMGQRPLAAWNAIAPGYFKTLGISLVRGRDFSPADDEHAPKRVIVSQSLARRFWPGPLTVIVKADPRLPLKVTANTGNVALRVPAAEVPLAIIRSAGLPITATSANLHGEVECTTAMAVRDQLGDCLSIIVDGGPCPGVMPSTIVDLTSDGSWRLLRHGAIPEEQIVELLGRE